MPSILFHFLPAARPHTVRPGKLALAVLASLALSAPLLAHSQQYELRSFVPALVALSSANATTDTSSLSFSGTVVGQTSGAQSVTVTNSGQDAMQMTAASVQGAFASSTNCGAALAGGASCTYNVTFKPSAMGAVSGSLTIPTSAGTRIVALSGTGLLTAASAGVGTVNFGDQGVGSTSTATAVVLSNTGNTAVSVTGVSTTGSFASTHNCPASLASGTSCTANVTFTPTAMGPAVGSLKFATSNGDKAATLSGNGLKTDVSVSSTALSLTSTTVGATSAAQSVVLTNTGNTTVAISAFTVSGPFAGTSSCPATLAVGTNCSYQVTFSPAVMGAASGTLSIPTEIGTKFVALSSAGLLANASVSGASLAFGNQAVGSSSVAQAITLTNDGNAPLSVSGVDLSGPYSATQNCVGTLAAGTSCTVNVVFTPVASGAVSGSVTLTTASGVKTVSLSGTGLLATADLGVTSLSFGNVTVSSTSTLQTVTLTNNGNTPTSLSTATLAAPFAVTTTCGASLAAGASCGYRVTFSPSAMGAASGTLSISTNLGTKTVSVSGFGQQTTGSTNVGSLTLASTNVGSSSVAQGVTLSNTGNTAMAVTSVSFTGPFNGTHNCSTVAVSGTCSINVIFYPSAMGSATGTLSIVTAAGTKTVSLSGVGLQATADLGTTSLNFNNVAVSTTSAAQVVSLTNNGNTPLTVGSITLPTPFSATSSCGASLASGSTCSFSVTFRPLDMYPASATLTIPTSLGVKTVSVAGTGLQTSGTASVANLNMGSVNVGSTSFNQFLSLSNTGNTPLTVSSLTVTGPFSATQDCGNLPASIATGNSCTVMVQFAPQTMGLASGILSITTADGVKTVSLTGTGQMATADLGVSSLSFGTVALNTQSPMQMVTLTNNGNAPLMVYSVNAMMPFNTMSSCGTVMGGSSCTISVYFMPNMPGFASANLSISTDQGMKTVTLSGTGQAQLPSASTSSLDLGGTNVYTTTLPRSVSLYNMSGSSVSVYSVMASNPAFAVTHNCSSLMGWSMCEAQVTFTPWTTGTLTGTLSFTTSSGTVTVNLAGTGTQVTADVSTTSLSFGNVNVASTSSAQSVNLTNNGNASLSLNPAYTSAPFAVTTNCGSILAGGSSCSYSLTYSPTAMGTSGGTLTLSTGLGQRLVSLSGTGLLSAAAVQVGSLDMGHQALNTTSAAQAVTLTNTGNVTLNLGGLALTGPFGVSTNCGAILAANASCTANVTFTPTIMGATSGSLSLYTTAGTQVVALSGTGDQTSAAISPASLTFANTGVGAVSAIQFVTFSNTGNTLLTISNTTSSGQFGTWVGTCGTSVNTGASCTVGVSFNPTTAASSFGTLSITSNAGVSSASLSGTGLGATLTTPTIATTQVAQTTTVSSTLTNTSPVALTLTVPSSASVTGVDYSFSSTTCGTTLAAGASCTVSVNFTPTAAVGRTGYINVTTAAGIKTVTLTGTGAAQAAYLAPGTLTFTSTGVGSTSAAQTVTLYNEGVGPLTVTPPAVLGDFTTTTTCGSTLAVLGSCTVSVKFVPSASGTRTATLSVYTGAGTSLVNLTGTGVVVDTSFSGVTALMHLDGANGSTTFTDVLGHAFTRTGTPTISTAQSKFGGASLLMAAGQSVQSGTSTDFALPGDFTVEAWIYPTGWPGNSAMVLNTNVSGGIQIGQNGSGGLSVASRSLAWVLNGSMLPALNTWSHIAVSRTGTTMTLYVNGVSIGSATNSTSFVAGQLMVSDPTYYYLGYVDEVRVTKGVGRYPGNFTVPSAAFPNQ